MSTFEIAESFNWLSPEFKLVDSGKNTIRIKGVALKGNVVSRNKRKYVDEELRKAARTWIGKPVTINHDGTKKVGHVVWMEYENGDLEYLADVNKQPYVGLLRNKSADIRGVSIEANYLHNRCPKCGDKFYTETDFAEHMWTKHFVKTDATKEPHGIVGQALSLVLAPEEPGYPDSTVELAETVGKPGLQLLETVIKAKEEEENYMAKLKEKAVVTPEKRMAWDQKLKEQDEHTCPEGEHWDDAEGKCVANVAEQEEHDCPEGKHWDMEKQECVPNKAEEQDERCPEGKHRDAETGECVPDKVEEQVEHECGEGEHWSEEEGKCVKDVAEQEEHECSEGEHWDDEEGKCVPDAVAEQNEQKTEDEIKIEMVALQQQIDALNKKTYPNTTDVAAQVELDALYAKKRGLEDLLALRQGVAEQDDSTQKCPVGFHRDPETDECVPDQAATPKPIPNVVVGEIKLQKPALKPKLVESLTPMDLRLGEPFAGYTNMDDCISKNSDKEDPAAWCATAKRNVEGETVKLPEGPMTELVKPIAMAISKEQVQNERRNSLRREKALLNKLNEVVEAYNNFSKVFIAALSPLHENDALVVKRLDEVVASLNRVDMEIVKQISAVLKGTNKSDLAIAKRLNEVVASLNKADKSIVNYTAKNVKILETKLATHVKTRSADVKKMLETLPKPDLTWKQQIATLNGKVEATDKQFKEAKEDYEKIMAKADSVHDENVKTLKTTTEELEKKGLEITALKEEITRLKETSDKKVKETQDLGVRVDNLEEKRKGKFSGHNKPEKPTQEEYAEDPRKGD